VKDRDVGDAHGENEGVYSKDEVLHVEKNCSYKRKFLYPHVWTFYFYIKASSGRKVSREKVLPCRLCSLLSSAEAGTIDHYSVQFDKTITSHLLESRCAIYTTRRRSHMFKRRR